MEKKKYKFFWGQLVVCVGLLVLIWGGYFIVARKMELQIEKELEDDFSWVVQVDGVEKQGENVVLSGFAFKINADAKKDAFRIVLRNLDTGEYLFPKMKYLDRKDVNDYFLCEYDYTNSGFLATVKTEEIDLQKNEYEVLLLPHLTHSPYRFATYISKGELLYTNPKTYEALDVEGTSIEEIVKEGVLRVYEPENHMYVYQYMGELYWIAEEEYQYWDNDVLEFLTYTTQNKRLPQQRLENNWMFDNIGFVFSSMELPEMSARGYRVSKKEIPTEYSIKKITTGNEKNGWIWKSEFRPRYEFKN